MIASVGVLARKDSVPSKSKMTPSFVHSSTRGPTMQYKDLSLKGQVENF